MAKKTTPTPERRLFRVRAPRVLHFPPQIVREPEMQIWAREGVALDLTDEVLWALTDGQRPKLEPLTAKEFDAAKRAGLVWAEEGAEMVVLNHLKEQRAAAVLPQPPPAQRERGASRGAQGTTTASIGDSAPPTTPEPPAKRRAADVEAALTKESG